jgi:trans-aconitate methyltransferase
MPEQNHRWTDYYKAVAGRSPRPLFANALFRFWTDVPAPADPFAIDLGCGDGTESLSLLQGGWSVLAIDSEPAAITTLQERVPPALQRRLQTQETSFEAISILPPAHFIYAGFSLPFCAPVQFESLWALIVAALQPGGRFAGQLFGENDSWAANPEMTFHSAADVQRLLRPLVVEVHEEVEEDGQAVSGPKHWHLHHIIARKR